MKPSQIYSITNLSIRFRLSINKLLVFTNTYSQYVISQILAISNLVPVSKFLREEKNLELTHALALGGGGGLAPHSGGGSLASKFGSTDLVFSINKHKKVDLSNFARYSFI